MTATSARRQKLWASAVARCIAVCKNTAWNEAAQLRTPDPAPGRRGGTAGLAHCVNSAVGGRLLLSHHLDFGAAHRRLVAWFCGFRTPPRGVLSADALEPSCGHARRGFLRARARRAARGCHGRSDDRGELAEPNATRAATGRAGSHRTA